MTDLEVMQRAKTYMDKLANGVNPLTDTPVPEGELLNNVRLCRCFFYVSDVLRRVIENGGQIGRVAKMPKAPFTITREQLNAFPFSDKPIPVSEIARRVSELVPEVGADAMSKFKYASITAFLLESGFLTEVETTDGKKVKRPTETGRSIGIFTEDRISLEGRPYTVVVYNRDAQQFLMDNMDAILLTDSGNKPTEDSDKKF
ncbi:MAG: hypothetical protein IJT94_12260 [Oscillibacter sp.]|nr:hypothetical protein [Oscillibacter sp.]